MHEWTCQLDYNPRLNQGWGLTDGEGSERIWAKFEPLVRRLRYSTKQHRLNAINFAALHKNDMGRMNAGVFPFSLPCLVLWPILTIEPVHVSLRHLRKTEEKFKQAQDKLARLQSAHGMTEEYFDQQWRRKKQLQSEALSQTSADYLEKLAELVDLEERLVAAQ